MTISRRPSPLGLSIALLGLIVVLTPNVLLPVCEGLLELASGKRVPMRCFWTGRAEMVMGGLILVAGLTMALIHSDEGRRRLSHQVAFRGLAPVLIPLYIIPTCDHPDMACNVGTKPALLLLGAFTLALGLWGSRAPRPSPAVPAA